MKRSEPGQVRVHRGFMRAGGSEELWPVEEIVARDKISTPSSSRNREEGGI
jgi:hypothetical protein